MKTGLTRTQYLSEQPTSRSGPAHVMLNFRVSGVALCGTLEFPVGEGRLADRCRGALIPLPSDARSLTG